MDENKPATIFFAPDVHRALRRKAAASRRSISAIVNEAVRMTLADDADDPRAADLRRAERSVSFDAVVREFRTRGRL